MREAALDAGVALSENLLGGVFVNQSAAFSDFHGTGANPAANASYTDGAYVASRFRIVQSRRHVADRPARPVTATGAHADPATPPGEVVGSRRVPSPTPAPQAGSSTSSSRTVGRTGRSAGEGGLVGDVGAGHAASGGRCAGRLADARPVGPARPPGPVDALQRPPRPHARALGRAGRRAGARERLEEWPDLPVIGWGHRPTAWDEVSRPSSPRRHRHRAADRADRRRRPPRLAQHRGPADAGAAPRQGGVVERGRVVHGLRPALDRARHRRHRPGGLPPHHGRTPPRSASSASWTSSSAAGSPTGPSAGPAART